MFIHSFTFNTLFHFTLVGIGYKFILSLDNKSNIKNENIENENIENKNVNIKTENVKNENKNENNKTETKYNYINPIFGPF